MATVHVASDDNVIRFRPDENIPAVRPPELRNEGGWLRSQRRIWHHDSMLTDFQEIAAWAYLYHVAEPIARHRPVAGREIYVREGEIATTIAYLATYWGWHRDRVRRFLGRLIVARRIDVSVVLPDGSERAMGAQCARNSRAIGVRIKVLNHKAYSVQENTTARNGKASPSDAQGRIRQETRDKEPTCSESRPEQLSFDTDSEPDTNDRDDSSPSGDGGARSRRRQSKAERERQMNAEFDQFWQGWRVRGTKRGRGDAAKAYRMVRHAGADPEQILAGLERYMRQCEQQQTELQFIKHPGAWLRSERWADETLGANAARVLTEDEIRMLEPDGPGWFTDRRKRELERLKLWPIPGWARKQAHG